MEGSRDIKQHILVEVTQQTPHNTFKRTSQSRSLVQDEKPKENHAHINEAKPCSIFMNARNPD